MKTNICGFWVLLFFVVGGGFFLLSATCFCGSERCCNVQMKIFLHPLLLKYFTWWLDSLNDVRNKCLPPSFLIDFLKDTPQNKWSLYLKTNKKKTKRKKKGGGVGVLVLFHYILKMHPIINAAWKFNFLWKTGGLNLTWDR